MSNHKTPLTAIEEAGARAHGLESNIGKPSQLLDVFRQGVAWGLANKDNDPHLVVWQNPDGGPPRYATLSASEVRGHRILTLKAELQKLLAEEAKETTPQADEYLANAKNMVSKDKFQAMRYLRQMTGCSLSEAKIQLGI